MLSKFCFLYRTGHIFLPLNFKTSIMKMKSFTRVIMILLPVIALVLFSGCAHKEDVALCLQGHVYGFWGGLWHGFIAPFDLIGMLFREDITMYAQNNNGAWYAFGFLLGSGGWGVLGGHGIRKRRHEK
jgi:hypothetical protein